MDLLQAKETRVAAVSRLLENHPLILSLRANYPGPDKDNEYTQVIIGELDLAVTNTFQLLDKVFLNCGEGPVYLYALNGEGHPVKEAAVRIEETHPLGRLVDLDVYYKDIKSISRKELHKPPRKCFLCGNEAFVCIRKGTHTLKELTDYIKKAVDDYGRSLT